MGCCVSSSCPTAFQPSFMFVKQQPARRHKNRTSVAVAWLVFDTFHCSLCSCSLTFFSTSNHVLGESGGQYWRTWGVIERKTKNWNTLAPESMYNCFPPSKARKSVEDCVLVFPFYQCKSLPWLCLWHADTGKKLKAFQTTQECASRTVISEQTIWFYYKEWLENGGSFPDNEQGKHKWHRIIDVENCQQRASLWVCEQ